MNANVLSKQDKKAEKKLNDAVVVGNFLELTQQVRSVLLQSNPQAEDGLKTASEMLEVWFDAMPKDVEKWLHHNIGFRKVV